MRAADDRPYRRVSVACCPLPVASSRAGHAGRRSPKTSPAKDTTVRGTAVGFIASAAVHLTQLATIQRGDSQGTSFASRP